MSTLTYVGTLVIIKCADCGDRFGIEDWYNTERRNDHKTFYCPRGHSNYFPHKSDKELLQDEIDKLQRSVDYKQTLITEKNHRIEQLNYSVRAQKAAKTKILNRVKNGVCPCCNRTFANLQAHFKTVHPELMEQPKP